MYLAENIRYLRKKNNMSQESLANMLGKKSFTTIQKWESGASEPQFKSLRMLSEIFGVDMDTMTNTRLVTDAEKFWEFAQDYNEKHFPQTRKLRDDENNILNIYNQLSDVNKKEAVSSLMMLLRVQSGNNMDDSREKMA